MVVEDKATGPSASAQGAERADVGAQLTFSFSTAFLAHLVNPSQALTQGLVPPMVLDYVEMIIK